MAAAAQRILLYKLKESLTQVDELLQATPSPKASAEEWKQWKERLDSAEGKLKERSTTVSSRTMSEGDQTDVARIHRSIDAARTKYEHVKWRADDLKPQELEAEPEADPAPTDDKQNQIRDAEESSVTDLEEGLDDDDLAESFSDESESSESSTSSQSTPAYEHPLSAVSGPTSLDGEKKLAEVIVYDAPCEACRYDKITCIREYVRRGRVRCDRCVLRGYRCSFPKADTGNVGTIVFDGREQRKRKAPPADDELLEEAVYKRARSNSRVETARPNSSKDHSDAPVSPSSHARQTNNSAMASFSASTSATRRSIHGNSDDLDEGAGESSHTALTDLIAQERTRLKDEISLMADTLKENMLSVIDKKFDRILQNLDAASV